MSVSLCVFICGCVCIFTDEIFHYMHGLRDWSKRIVYVYVQVGKQI
jgi:hypothetical protein